MVGVGRYCEHRAVYTTAAFAPQDGSADPDDAAACTWASTCSSPAGTPVHAPLDGVVRAAADNAEPLDYGGPSIVRGTAPTAATPFFTLYGHLSRRASLVREGTAVAAGEVIGARRRRGRERRLAAAPALPAAHRPLRSRHRDAGRPRRRAAPPSSTCGRAICPDPNLLLRRCRAAADRAAAARDDIAARRARP